MRYAALDAAVRDAERFLSAAKGLKKAVAQDRLDFPEHTFVITADYPKQVVMVRRLSSDLSNTLTILRRST